MSWAKLKRKLLITVSVMTLCVSMLGINKSMASKPDIRTNAKSAALIDVTSGRILYSDHGDEPMRIASLTKIMTAIVAIEHGKLSDKVTVSKKAFGKEGSSIYLKLGEQMSLEDMLYGLMLRSGNDAATAIAEHVGGSEDGFVMMMNQKAELIGLKNTQFKNPHGLDAEGHYSSANDLAMLTAYAMKNVIFREIVKTKVKKAHNPNETWDYSWSNKNKMLNMYDGADGVKTGYTKKAFRCLVSSATRNGQQLVAVTLNDGSDWVDHAQLLDYGFATFPLQVLIEKGNQVQHYSYRVGRTFAYPLAKGEMEQLHTTFVLTDKASLNYTLGSRGSLVLKVGQTQVGVLPVYDDRSPLLQTKHRSVYANEQQSIVQPFVRTSSNWADQFIKVLRGLFVYS